MDVPIQAVSADNEAFVVTEANAKTLAARQVSLHSGQTVAEIMFPKLEYADIEVSPDGHWVVAMLHSGQLAAWDFSTGKRRTLSVRKEEHVTFKQFVDPDLFFTVNQTGQAVAWSVPQLIATPLAQGCSNIFFVSSRHIFTQPPIDVNTLEVRDVSTGNVLSILRGHQSRVVAMALAPDGRTVATASWDSTVRIWGLPGGDERQVFRAQRQGVYSLALSPDGRTLAAAGADGTVTLWHLATGQKLLTLPAMASGCSRVMFTRKTLAAWCSNRTRFWSAADY